MTVATKRRAKLPWFAREIMRMRPCDNGRDRMTRLLGSYSTMTDDQAARLMFESIAWSDYLWLLTQLRHPAAHLPLRSAIEAVLGRQVSGYCESGYCEMDTLNITLLKAVAPLNDVLRRLRSRRERRLKKQRARR